MTTYWLGVLGLIIVVVYLLRITLFTPKRVDPRRVDAEIDRQLKEMGIQLDESE